MFKNVVDIYKAVFDVRITVDSKKVDFLMLHSIRMFKSIQDFLKNFYCISTFNSSITIQINF